MAATPEVLTQQALQNIRTDAIQLLDGVKPRPDWSWLIIRTVTTFGVIPFIIDPIAKLVGSNRLTLWQQCHIREATGWIETDGEKREARVFSLGEVPPAQAKEIIVAPDPRLGAEYLCLKQNGGTFLESDIPLGRGAVMGGIKIARPDLTKAQYYRGVLERIRQLQAA